jgi:hypothetical protein
MMGKSGMPFLKCGKVFNVKVPNRITKKDLPIVLAAVSVNTKNIQMPCVLVNYSQVLQFDIFDFNPSLSIVYRLVRQSNRTGKPKLLEEWNFRASEIFPTRVRGDINTIEPLVLNFCDCLENDNEDSFTYIVQIADIASNNAAFRITNQEISAIASCGESE